MKCDNCDGYTGTGIRLGSKTVCPRCATELQLRDELTSLREQLKDYEDSGVVERAAALAAEQVELQTRIGDLERQLAAETARREAAERERDEATRKVEADKHALFCLRRDFDAEIRLRKTLETRLARARQTNRENWEQYRAALAATREQAGTGMPHAVRECSQWWAQREAALQNEVNDLRAQLAAVTAERDEARADAAEWELDCATAEAGEKRLGEELERYRLLSRLVAKLWDMRSDPHKMSIYTGGCIGLAMELVDPKRYESEMKAFEASCAAAKAGEGM